MNAQRITNKNRKPIDTASTENNPGLQAGGRGVRLLHPFGSPGPQLVAFTARFNRRFAAETHRSSMAQYRNNPAKFAHRILGSRWWARQEDIAKALVAHRRVVVKSANGVGKTYLAADLVLWFLYAFQPAIVLTTAPTWRQVRHVLWEEIRKRFNQANSYISPFPTRDPERHYRFEGGGRGVRPVSPSPGVGRGGWGVRALPGNLLCTRLNAGE